MIDPKSLQQLAQFQRQFQNPAFQRFIRDAGEQLKAINSKAMMTPEQSAQVARALRPALEQNAKVARAAFQAMQSAQFKNVSGALEDARRAYAEYLKAQNRMRADLRARAKALNAANEAMQSAILDARTVGLSFREIADLSGFSHETVRRIEADATEGGDDAEDDAT